MDDKPYADFGAFLKKYFRGKVQKISINAGFTCPNRDGTKGNGGCTYCNNQTFSPEYCHTDKSITEQLEEGIGFFGRKYPDMEYLAYFQAYTNTYGDLRRINRGHTFSDSADAVMRTANAGVLAGAHMILGLPGEDREMIISHAERLSQLPLSTLKLHQLQLIRNTRMAYEQLENPEEFHLFDVDEYIDLVIDFIEHLRPDITVERFVSQSPDDLLIAPKWGLKNHEFTARLLKRMLQRNSRQGKMYVPSVL